MAIVRQPDNDLGPTALGVLLHSRHRFVGKVQPTNRAFQPAQNASPVELTNALRLELFAQVLDEFLFLFFSESLSKFFLLCDDCLQLFHRFLERL